ncbi:uncharacterized protein LOC144111101 [Amblyomma americanum]
MCPRRTPKLRRRSRSSRACAFCSTVRRRCRISRLTSAWTRAADLQLVVDRGIRERRVTVQLLTTSSNVTFRGFLIRSMAVRGSSFIYFRGIFEKDTQFQDSLYLDCDGQDRSAISHGDNKTKKEVVVHWRPEPDPKNLVQVFFRATVVQNFNRYFIHLDSIRLLFGTAGPSTFGRLSFVGLLGSCVAPAAVALFYAWME